MIFKLLVLNGGRNSDKPGLVYEKSGLGYV